MVEVKSILEQVYADGVKEGYWSGRQVASCKLDDAYEQGRLSAKIPKRWPVFLIGFFMGVVGTLLL